MKTRNLAIVAMALFLPFAAAACGGSDDTNSGSRPSAEEISATFAKELPASTPNVKGVADCLGKKLEASDLPNGVLRSIVAGEDKTQVDADNKEKYTKIVTDASTACVKEVLAGG